MRWKPNVTVAAIIEQAEKFLLVEERIDGQLTLNQPAGHWEFGESLTDAVIRETREETGWQFSPTGLTGIYAWQVSEGQQTFLRFAFHGELLSHDPTIELDTPIVALHWLSADEIRASQARHRSPQVLRCLEDYLSGARFPLDCLKTLD